MELTLKEVAARLHMPIETLMRWIRQGKIPMHRSCGEYTIRSEMLERWADEHQLKVHPSTGGEALVCVEAKLDGIGPAMRRGGIFHDLEGNTKEQVLHEAMARIPNLDPSERPLVLGRLLERERMASTGIGHGIALPHPRANPGIQLALPQITTCFLVQPIAYDAIDQRPVSVLMVLLSGSTQLHLSLLSKLSFYLRDTTFRNFLLGAPPAEDVLRSVDQLESNHT
jgi:PTS system nitrogen regulatory IIA component